MKILLAEYAVATNTFEFMLEGKAMLQTLVRSFASCGHEVFYPTAGVQLDAGTGIPVKENFEESLEMLSRQCHAALVIAPDELLEDLTLIIEKNTINLGCSSECIRICADKLRCTRILEKNNLPVPETIESGEYYGDYVIKPRFGCASEEIYKSSKGLLKKNFIATRFIQGEHISVSLISGKTTLPLTINKQFIEIKDKISYRGATIPYTTKRKQEIIETAIKVVNVLGCRGYVGLDMVIGDLPYVVDVNPRPTTSIIGIARILETEIAELILKSRFGELPSHVSIKDSFSFKIDELSL